MTYEEAFKQINETQDYYVDKLKKLIENNNESYMKTYSFQSDTGTGKTKMMAKLIKSMPDYFFLVTSLSKADLSTQIQDNLDKDLRDNGFTNYIVYGTMSYKKGSKLQATDIISKLPTDKKCIWLRDEGHIATQNFTKLLENYVFKIIDISATPNIDSGIKCNFTNTMMLRAVEQHIGTPEDAIKKLLEVKKQHKCVPNYNPCAIFRCVKTRSSNEDVEEDENIVNQVKQLCIKYKLKYKHIKDGKEVKPLCKDDNEVDVIINKFIITEGIDIRRAHVLYMDNQPGNINTTVQAIGRCRRNALLYNKDAKDDYPGTGVDILDPKNEKLLENTRICYVYYNVKSMNVDSDENSNLCQSLCNTISCQRLKPEQISVKNGQLPNGLLVEELKHKTGNFNVSIDPTFLSKYNLEFNIVDNPDFYRLLILDAPFSIVLYECQNGVVYKINLNNLDDYAIQKQSIYDWSTGKYKEIDRLIYKFYLLDHSKYYKKFISRYKIEKFIYDGLDIALYNIRQKALSTYKKLGRVFSKYNPPYLDLMLKYKSYKHVCNDAELAIVGCENFRLTKDGEWTQSRSMASKVNISSKFGQFISAKYTEEIKCFTENKSLYKKKTIVDESKDSYKLKELDTKCNSCLGYCVEYYSKYLIYGESYLRDGPFDYIAKAQEESHTNSINDGIIIRACMSKYKYFMSATFGGKVDTVIKTISVEKLIQEKYSVFVSKVKLYANRVVNFINANIHNIKDSINIYPVLSTKHITGLVDYMTEDTILDVKTTNGISEGHIRQVLAYHYLSTTRTDLHINRVIVFDAITNNGIIIPITAKNQISKI